MKRDKTIDHFRGFAMLWVIVVHSLYWGNFFTNEYINFFKSFCLFEMPLFFFVTGASNSLSKVSSYFDFVIKRFRRILIPYWIFALICAVLSIVKLGVNSTIDLYTAIKVLLSWLIPSGNPMTSVSYLNWALWFIPVYLCVVMIIPLLKRMNCSKQKISFAFLLVALFFMTSVLKMGWIQNVAFYSFWTYVGLFYRDITLALKEKKQTKMFFLCSASIGIVTLCVLHFCGQPLDMQYNKFPPNSIFFVYSITAMSFIILLTPFLDRLFKWLGKYTLTANIINLFSTRSLTIFLYQVFAFNVSIRCTNMIIHSDRIIPSFVKLAFCLATTVLLCAGLACIMGRFEKLNKPAGSADSR